MFTFEGFRLEHAMYKAIWLYGSCQPASHPVVYDPAVGVSFCSQQKHAAGLWEHASYGCCDFSSFLESPWSMSLPQAFLFPENTPLNIWSMHLVDFINSYRRLSCGAAAEKECFKSERYLAGLAMSSVHCSKNTRLCSLFCSVCGF